MVFAKKTPIGMSKKDLQAANKAKNDEFYTQLNDIQLELSHYKKDFKDKIVLCNCDDPYESNFFKYFSLNFNALGLKKLIATCYDPSPIAGRQLNLFEDNNIEVKDKKAYKIEIEEILDANGDGCIDLTDVEILLKNNKNALTTLEGDGDFRSKECVELLKQSDIVVTNPPFSLFREYIALLERYDKSFIIMGNTNALTYKEIFKLFQQDKIRTGNTNFNVGMYFFVPDSFEKYHKIEGGRKMVRVSTSCWYTNLEVKKHKEKLISFKQYNSEEYPKYDNYDAINVNKYTDIPYDYDGIMGVPITFLDKYNPNQFELIGQMATTKVNEYNFGYPYVNGKKIYARILIRRKQNSAAYKIEDSNTMAAEDNSPYGNNSNL
jgi:hypothetical protein